MTPDPTPQPGARLPGFCSMHGERRRFAQSGPGEPGCTCETYLAPTPQPAHDHGAAGFCGNHAQPPDERTETVEARLAKYAFDEEPLGATEVESIRAGRCGPLLYGGPCWLMPGHVGPHHCYRDDIAAVVAALDPEEPR